MHELLFYNAIENTVVDTINAVHNGKADECNIIEYATVFCILIGFIYMFSRFARHQLYK